MTSAAPTIDQGAESSTTDLNSTPPAPVGLVDLMSGPHTIVALGEDCLVCEEGLEPGQVYVFCRHATGSGVAHESCADVAGTKPAGLVHTDRALLR
jgi:hypothetical protein